MDVVSHGDMGNQIVFTELVGAFRDRVLLRPRWVICDVSSICRQPGFLWVIGSRLHLNVLVLFICSSMLCNLVALMI